MSSHVAKRLATWGLVGSLLLILAIAAALGATQGAWSELVEWTEVHNLEFESRDFTRPVLWGEPEQGLAASHYDAAEAIANANKADYDDLVNMWRGGRSAPASLPVDRERAIRDRWAAAVAEMRRGARCNYARPSTNIRMGFSAPVRNLLAMRWLANLATLDAWDRSAAGEHLDAARIVLDTLAFGRDLLESPQVIDQHIACAIMLIALREGCTESFVSGLDDRALGELGKGLQVCQGLLPSQIPHGGELLLMANWLVDSPELLEETVSLSSAWRYAFSRRALALTTFDRRRELVRALREDAPERFPERGAWLAKAIGERFEGNPLAPVGLEPMELLYQRVRVELSLLQMAVALHRGTKPMSRPDPFSKGDLQIVTGPDGEVTLRSAGEAKTRPIERMVTLR